VTSVAAPSRLRAVAARLVHAPGVSASALVAFSAAAVGAGLGRSLVTTYLPVLLERIRDAPGLIGTVMLVNTVAGFVVPLAAGVWSDRLRLHGHGRTLPLVLGGTLVAAGGLAAIALGHASSYVALALLAAVTYVGLNAVTTGHRALIPETFDDDGRGAATAGEELAMLVGTLAGVALGGVLVAQAGWAPFALGAAVLPLLAVPTVRRMRGRERPAPARELPRHPGLRYYARAALRPGGRLVLAAQWLWVLGYVGLPPFFVLYADRVLGLGPAAAGGLLAAFGLLTGAAMLGAGAIAAERRAAVLLVAAPLMGAGLLAVAAASSVPVAAAALVPVAAGFGALTALGFPVFARHIPEGEEGAYSALYFAVRALAAVVALPAAGWTIAATGSYRAVFVLGGVAALLAVVPLARLERRTLTPDRLPPAARRVAALVAGTAAAFGLALLIDRTELLEADEAVFDALRSGFGVTPHWVDALLVDPHLQNYTALSVITGLAAWRWGDGRGVRAALRVVLAGLLAYAAVRTCWALWERPRPQEVLGALAANGHDWSGFPSFPSGHAAVTAAIVVAAWRQVPRLLVPLALYLLVIALTRVTYGAHFPSDVLLAVGLGWLAAGVAVPARLPVPRLEAPQLRLWAGGLAVAALALFVVLTLAVGAPVSPDGALLAAREERAIQLALLAFAAVCLVAAWRHPRAGASLVVVGSLLGVFAAAQYTPGFAVFAALALAVPGTLFLLARRDAGRGTVAFVVAVMAVGGVAALAVHDAAFGPATAQSSTAPPPPGPVAWAWSGAVGADGVTVTARLTRPGRARLLVAERPDLRGALASAPARTEPLRTVSLRVGGLRAGTRHWYALEVDGRLVRDRVGSFRTVPRGRSSFTFAFSSCARTGSNAAVFDAIRAVDPLFFLVSGDLFYADIDENSRSRFLTAYDRLLTQPAPAALLRSTAAAYVWDDHDFGGAAGSSSESAPAARWAFDAAVPHHPLGGRTINQAFTAGRVRFLLLDTRSARVPGVTMLGREQLAWLERELVVARDRAALTVVVSPVPWIGGEADGWGGYPAERARLSRLVARERITNLLMLAGDAHMLAIDDGSNSDHSGTGRGGFPVFHAGALDRPGSVKGGPYSEGAFPGAGQFGTVTVRDEGARVTVTLTGRDRTGAPVVTHRFTRTVPAR
jgi:MFS family permease/3',5'-cyclic AMP phosphodiesterase CpdA